MGNPARDPDVGFGPVFDRLAMPRANFAEAPREARSLTLSPRQRGAIVAALKVAAIMRRHRVWLKEAASPPDGLQRRIACDAPLPNDMPTAAELEALAASLEV
jgi:hypothetical protein